MKRLFNRAMFFAMFLIVMVVPSVQASQLDESGNLDNTKPTKSQIRDKWNQVTYATTLYEEEPSVNAPHVAGKLSDNFLESGITYLNYVRYVANLPQVQLDDELNDSAQHGAVLLAAVDTLTHYPEQPNGMDDDFYNKGYAATTSSNLSARYGYSKLTCLQGAVSGCMDDNSSLLNLQTVGHRRWLLNPTLLNVGFGYAEAESGWCYAATKVFDNSGSGCDYDFISWPASGNFPTNLFNIYNPWSVTLNPSKYQTPSLDNLSITITRQSDGKKWNFNSATGQPSSYENAYLTVENSYYGIPNCIIFHPGSANVDDYEGIYQVDISGLYTTSGQAAQLQYQVDFFDVEAEDYYEPVTIVTQPKSVTVAEGETAKVTVEATGDGLSYRWYYKNKGASDYTYTSSFKGNSYYITMNEARNGRRVVCRVYDKYGNVVQTNTVKLSMKNTVKITQQPVSVNVFEGETAKVTVKATGDGLTYRWYYKDEGESSYTYTSSYKGSSYSVPMTAVINGRRVVCRVYDKYGNVVQTDTVKLSMKQTVKIVQQPESVTVAKGEIAKVTVKATGDGLTYRWYYKNPGQTGYSYTSTYKKNTYSVRMDETRNGRYVVCRVYDKYGNVVQTNSVSLRMK